MYREIQRQSINHSQQTLGASPPLPQGLFSGNHHAAPITFCMVGAALLLSVYLYVSRTEAFFMASNTSYLKRL
jgi:hypothetical protein